MSAVEPAFEWEPDSIRRVGYRVVDLIADHLASLPAGPVFRPVPESLATALVSQKIPQYGIDPDSVLAFFATVVGAHPFGNGHPRFYGWVNSPPAVISVLAEAFAAAVNPSVAGGNHAAVWVERQVLEWFKQLFGFPSRAMGLFVSGGSMAALTALAVARHRALARRGINVRAAGVQSSGVALKGARFLVYKDAECHGCHQKAIELLGLGAENAVEVPVDATLCMRADALDERLARDLAAGEVPLAVIATAGTVNTGSIDPIDAIADVCQKHEVWLHVDGTYGAPALLSREYSSTFVTLSRADSLAVDPHKWLYVPVDSGVVLIKDAQAMRDAFSLVPPYLRTDDNAPGIQGPPWFSEFGFEQTRPFRALATWAALCYFGTAGYARLIQNDIHLARRLAAVVRAEAGFEVWEPQGLSIVCFRAVPVHLSPNEQAVEALNRSVLNQLQLSGAGFLTSTIVDGRFWLRACIVNPRATEGDVTSVFDVVRAIVRRELETDAVS